MHVYLLTTKIFCIMGIIFNNCVVDDCVKFKGDVIVVSWIYRKLKFTYRLKIDLWSLCLTGLWSLSYKHDIMMLSHTFELVVVAQLANV